MPTDRVFVHALATVRRLPRTGSSRPPPSARLRLYGLYKQSMEGDVENILPRPTLPPPSPMPHETPVPSDHDNRPSAPPHRDSTTSQHTVHRYASRDLRTREAQAEIEKWDAWHACAGMSRTEAKRQYIEALIETMKQYASGTQESRELVGELEFVWGQIRSQSGSGDGGSRGSGGRSDAAASGREDADGESPRRSGLKGLGSDAGARRLGDSRGAVDGEGRRMRMLSPMSPRGGSDIIEGADADDLDDDLDENLPAQQRNNNRSATASRFAALEAQLRRLSTEIAALREQLSANHMLSSSSYSPHTYQYHQLSLRWKLWYRMVAWVRWLVWLGVRQVWFGGLVLGALVLWGRWNGDRRAEEWARRRWKEVSVVLVRWVQRGWWGVDLLRMKVMLVGGAH